ncbi:hypothetical protein CEXT_735371 [Caerostris extrusa]|uniref:Uncharacterized protein n=1 Tax=Caerostris extrusa TaxID=172846 RepID=A0AAV4Y6E7_CAEEX|nr:hypothetical protein CEXT_735371 [Caerostris extrusa]
MFKELPKIQVTADPENPECQSNCRICHRPFHSKHSSTSIGFRRSPVATKHVTQIGKTHPCRGLGLSLTESIEKPPCENIPQRSVQTVHSHKEAIFPHKRAHYPLSVKGQGKLMNFSACLVFLSTDGESRYGSHFYGGNLFGSGCFLQERLQPGVKVTGWRSINNGKQIRACSFNCG